MRVVFTNGCFDILHAGHVAYLEAARKLGDWLIVAVNDDESVRSLKGNGRPINPLADRIRVIAALRCVDRVVPMRGLRCDGMLQTIRPQVWAKGGDYTLESLDPGEVAAARRVGAEICIIPMVAGRSTTAIIQAIKEPPGEKR